MISFQRTTLLRFYDAKKDAEFMSAARGAHVAAITAVIGEELLLRLYFHYMQNKEKVQCRLLDGRPKRVGEKVDGRRGKGNWLDAWVQLGVNRLAQVEIKNWSAHSLGEKSLALDATLEDITNIATARWKRFFGQNDKLPIAASKIKHAYLPPKNIEYSGNIERVLLFWLPLSQDTLRPLTTATIDGVLIKVFSASVYLRTLTTETIELDCPDTEARIKLLNALQGR